VIATYWPQALAFDTCHYLFAIGKLQRHAPTEGRNDQRHRHSVFALSACIGAEYAAMQAALHPASRYTSDPEHEPDFDTQQGVSEKRP